MSDDQDSGGDAATAELRVESNDIQADLDEHMTRRVENGYYGDFSAGSGGERNPGTLPNGETAQRYVDIPPPPGVGNYHEFELGVKDIYIYWSALAAIDANLIDIHAKVWRHCAEALDRHSTALFHRKNAVEGTWQGEAASMFFERVNAARFSMDEWASAASWIASKLELLAAAVPWRQNRLYPIFYHYEQMMTDLFNWPEGRPIVIYDPAAPGWSPEWPTTVKPFANGEPLTDNIWQAYQHTYLDAEGFLLLRGNLFENLREITSRYHEHAAELVQPLAQQMVDVHQEIYARTPVQFYGHVEAERLSQEHNPDVSMPAMPGVAAPNMPNVAAPSMPEFAGTGAPATSNMPGMPAGMPGMAGYHPATSPFAQQLARLGQPDGTGLAAGLPDLPDNGELALMPDGTVPGFPPGTGPFGPGTGGGTTPGIGPNLPLPPPPGGGLAPSLPGATSRPGFTTGPAGTGVPGAARGGVGSVPSINGVPGVPDLPGINGVPGGNGVAGVSDLPGLNGVPGGNGVPDTNGAVSGSGVPATLPGAAGSSLAATPHGGMGMMPPPMMPPMMPPMAGQPARRDGQAGQGDQPAGAVPPGMPGMFIPPGTVNQRGASPTAPQPRPATLPGAARTASGRPGLGRLAGLAQPGRAADLQRPTPATPGRTAERTAPGDQEMWRVEKAKGSLGGPAPQPPAPRRKPPAAAG